MLEQILDFIHNYFIREVHRGKFNISDGTIDLDFLQNGQYFKIVGSVFNDGIYQYPRFDLMDETFVGEIWAMAVPSAVIALSNDIEKWQEQYGDKSLSPYQSESFGGYSYTKASASTGGQVDWRTVFRSRLNRWRKIS